jgi:hypothetical protein
MHPTSPPAASAFSSSLTTHIPQLEAPARFVAVLERFLEQTEPARFEAAVWRARFQTTVDERQRAGASRRAADRRTQSTGADRT